MIDIPVPFTTEWVKDGYTYTYVVRDQQGNPIEANPGWTVTHFPEGAGWKLMRYGDRLIDEGMFVTLGLAIRRANAVMASLHPPTPSPHPKGRPMNDSSPISDYTGNWVQSNRGDQIVHLFIIRDQSGVVQNPYSGWMITEGPEGCGWALTRYGRQDVDHGRFATPELAMEQASVLMLRQQPQFGRFEKDEGKEQYRLVFRNPLRQAIRQEVEIVARLTNPERPYGDWELVKYVGDQVAFPAQITRLTREAWQLIRQGTFPHPNAS